MKNEESGEQAILHSSFSLLHSPNRRRHDEILADIARFAGSSLDLDQVLERIAQRAAELTGADRASVLLLDPAGVTLLPSALYGMEPEFTRGWKTRPLALDDEPLSREAVETRRPVVVPDARRDPRTDKASVEFFGDQSILVAPLVSREQVLGTLFLNHVRRRYEFTADDVETTSAIASQAAFAIHNARLFRDTQRLADQLRKSFGYAGEALASGDNVQHTLQMMLQLSVETVGAAGGELALLDETGRSTYLVASAGEPKPDGEETAEFPLATAERLLGTLTLWRPHLAFAVDEQALLESFAGHARIAIEHARLYASLQEERERARIAERAQADFTSMISHELRTPLALIQGYVSTLMRPGLSLTPDQSRRFLEGINQACDRLRKLIDNLLSANAVDAVVRPNNPETLDVVSLVKQAIADVSLLASGRTFTLDGSEGQHLALGDRDQLRQVVENLLSNAVKYAPGETPIEVRVSGGAGRVVLAVRDYGPGIPPQALGRVFEKFYRLPAQPGGALNGAAHGGVETGANGAYQGEVDRAATRRPAGLGLGLYICRRIVEAHGGRIWAENISEGGAAFYLELPAVLQGPAARAAEAPGSQSGQPAGAGATAEAPAT